MHFSASLLLSLYIVGEIGFQLLRLVDLMEFDIVVVVFSYMHMEIDGTSRRNKIDRPE